MPGRAVCPVPGVRLFSAVHWDPLCFPACIADGSGRDQIHPEIAYGRSEVGHTMSELLSLLLATHCSVLPYGPRCGVKGTAGDHRTQGLQPPSRMQGLC